ncbi:MAG: acyl-CoA thioesterase [Cyanophyceae cyanobacterium]
MSFIYKRTVYLADTDAAGVVYFAQALSICHEAYEASLVKAGIELKTFFNNPTVAVPVVQAHIDFLRPLLAGDRLLVTLSPRLLSDSEFGITYHIVADSSPQQIVVKANTRHVCITLDRRRTAIPEALKQWLVLT